VRALFALALILLALILLSLLLWAGLTWAGTTRFITYEEKTPGCWHTLCAAGTWAVSTDNRTLERWDTAITGSPRNVCTGPMNPRIKQM
jgi:hypothetical protein